VVPVGDEHEVAVSDGDRDVDAMAGAVEALDGEGLGPSRAVVVDLFENDLVGRPVLVVLVGRVTRPVARRREHLDDEKAMGREVGRQDVVDLPRGVSGAARLDRHVAGSHERGREGALAPCPADGELEVGERVKSIRRSGWQVQRPGHPVEDVPAPAELEHLRPRLDETAATKRYECYLVLSGRELLARPRGPRPDTEREMPPAGRFARDRVPIARLQQEVAHTSAASISSSLGIASEHAS
jgi:hypothetical protein